MKWYKILIWLTVFALLVFVFTAMLFIYLGCPIEEILFKADCYRLSAVITGLGIIFYLFNYIPNGGDTALKESELENISFLKVKELKRKRNFTVSSFDKLFACIDGTVIGAEKKGKKVEVIMTEELHTLVIGSTGTGKTTGFIDQNISCLSSTKSAPSLIIADPKKELYARHAGPLIEKGYEVLTLDLRDPYSSGRWNPMAGIIRKIKEVKELEGSITPERGKYRAGGRIYETYKDALIRITELKDGIYDDAKDLIYTLCPVENKDQPTWEEGARNLILGMVLAFAEDCIAGKMDTDKLLLYNLYHNISAYCNEDVSELKRYLIEERDEFSPVIGLVQSVLITSDRTLTSYLSDVHRFIELFSDNAIVTLTSSDDMNLIKTDSRPTAIFVIIPDEKVTRHRFATLFFTQCYKMLVEKAVENERFSLSSSSRLERNVYFILDEFGNLPKFDNFDTTVTVARSRGIRIILTVQSYAQLDGKYGRDAARTIKSNCNVKVFLGTDDPDTRKEFSEMCGNRKIKNMSISSSVGKDPGSSVSVTTMPLISPVELEHINGTEKGEAVIQIRGENPIKTRFTPSYKLSEIYFKTTIETEKEERDIVDKKELVHDIGKLTDDEELLKKLYEEEDEVPDLDEEESVMDAISMRIASLSGLIPDKMYRSLSECLTEDLPMMLRELKDKTDPVISLKMENAAYFIEKELEKIQSK